MQFLVHYFLHLVFPFFIAVVFYKGKVYQTYIVFLLTMLVDLDHLLASPVYDASRCSIGFHPLHSYIAIGVYMILLLPPKSRVVAIGLLLHMVTDKLDCFLGSI